MNDKLKFPFWDPDWIASQPDWFKYQNQCMDAWSSFRQFMPSTSAGNPQMAGTMNNQWKSASPSLSGQYQDFYEKMMQQGQVFYFIGEQFSKLLEEMNEVNSQSEEWQIVLNDQFESMKSMLEGGKENMQAAFTYIPSMKGGFVNEYFKTAEMTSFMDKLLSVPGVGPDRKIQAQTRKGIRLFNEYQQVFNEYNAEMSKVGVEALQALRLRILEMAEQGKEINSLREIYDLWVDCNEKAYTECVYTDEYSELYGRLTNTLLALKQHNGKLVDQLLIKFNIPTRQGMNTVLKRLQETKRAQTKSIAKIGAMEDEIRALRQLIEDGKKPSLTTTQLSASSRPTKKKASKKTGKKKMTKKMPNKSSK